MFAPFRDYAKENPHTTRLLISFLTRKLVENLMNFDNKEVKLLKQSLFSTTCFVCKRT